MADAADATTVPRATDAAPIIISDDVLHGAPIIISDDVLQSGFVQQVAETPLRVCCYGSSSSDTPERYMSEARSLGYILGKRGHTCVNGAGAYGCMAAMNDGCYAADGILVGVIHEMWLAKSDTLRDDGAHKVFTSTENAPPPLSPQLSTQGPQRTPLVQSKKRQILVAGGKDLQERKRMLVDKADALVVLPGGPGTWDELWEMACARGIGLTTLPIVCINCDGFYEPFREMLKRAYTDKLTKLQPHELVHFEPMAEAAVRWVESVTRSSASTESISDRSKPVRGTSFFHNPIVNRKADSAWPRSLVDWFMAQPYWIHLGCAFVTGLTLGATLRLDSASKQKHAFRV